MSLKKLLLKSGVNRENTRYTSEGGWYECDKIRFRQGTPEKIGGWQRISATTFQGVCRSLWNWVTLGSQNLIAVGTNLKYYIENGGAYSDITPLRATVTLTNPFATTSGSPIVTVTDANGGYTDGDYVTYSGASAVGGLTLNGEYQLTLTTTTNEYTIDAGSAASSTATGGGTVTAAYQINVGTAFAIPLTGWGAGSWSSGIYGVGVTSTESIRLWSESNFGEDLVFGPRGGGMYYWDASNGLTTRGVELSSLGGASNVPTSQKLIEVSDINRFVFAFGANEFGTATVNPMLVRWSDQGSAIDWTPSVTSQAGFLTLSNGTEIIAAKQARQEVLVWTDSALYSLQYVGAPVVWSAQLVGENISTAAQNCVAYANGVAYWMGKDKFYKYDGRTQPLRCDLRKFIFGNFNEQQYEQVFAGTNESYHEIWWFYCSADATAIDRYVVYNYLEDIWYYGTMARTAWLDSGLRGNPLAATYSHNLVNHEEGVDDNETATTAAIHAFIASAEFDLEDGHQFAFIWRILPDIRFDGSTTGSPSATMTLLPLANSGSGYNDPLSEGGSNSSAITRTAVLPVEAYTGQIYTRVRGRQLAMKVESTDEGVTWQLGSPRIDMRPDGRR
tara:strand:+ start:107 stop:1954 length:1848 start_codon:yes stop_codon:yes gene_type:complete